jgi:hypothetical protein
MLSHAGECPENGIVTAFAENPWGILAQKLTSNIFQNPLAKISRIWYYNNTEKTKHSAHCAEGETIWAERNDKTEV